MNRSAMSSVCWFAAVACASPLVACIALCDTVVRMAQAISVRLDDEAERALRTLEASGLTRSQAIRLALVDSARRLRRRSELAAEVALLEADEADRAEMAAVAELMDSLRAPG
jgi:antitoxin component of RelBE/YafQ-DinJ toxin-antitoxin module